ncbi:MAG: hypothetical protein ACI8S6_000045 [Myxococcota bacterium]|jgi:hypothetical protein
MRDRITVSVMTLWTLWTLWLLGCSGKTLPATTDGDTAHSDAGLWQSGPIQCADPDARSSEGRLYTPDLGADWLAQPGEGHPYGSGIAVEDFNGDGWLDLFLPDATTCLLYFGSSDGTLASAEVPTLCGGAAATAMDVDGDGDIDLLVSSRMDADQLFINDGTGRFADEASERGLGGDTTYSSGFSPGDIDGDGDVDLFWSYHGTLNEERVPELGAANRLLLNDGDGFFREDSAQLSDAARLAYTFLASWLDVDADGDLDLYQNNDYGAYALPNVLLSNDGDGNLSTAAPAGVQLAINGMGTGIGDANDDGLPDLLVTDWGSVHLLLSDGDGGWYDAAAALGLSLSEDRVTSWAAELVDMDNDSLLDAAATFGPLTNSPVLEGYDNNPSDQPDALWIQQPDGSFIESSQSWGFDDTTLGRGMVIADLDQDGWLDTIKRDFRGGPSRISLARCGEAGWLTIRLEGTAPNTQAIGAKVTIESNNRRQLRWVQPASTGFASSAPAQLHFGLGDTDLIDAIQITWPGGDTTRYTDIPALQHLVVTQADAPIE